MGKRELLLVVAFVVLGIVVYQFTAPPPPPGGEGFSVGGFVRSIRRGVKGPTETATEDSSQTAPVPASVSLLRVNISRVSDLTITGEDRKDVAASLHVMARGFDPAEAAAAAKGPKVTLESSADAVAVSLDFASGVRSPRQAPPPMMSLTLRVPRRLALRVEPHIGQFVVSHVAGAEIMSSRGETKISGLTNDLRLTHNGGTLEISDVPSLKLTVRGSHATVKDVAGPVSADATGGSIAFTGIGGPIEIEARNTELTLEADEHLKPELRINMTGGLLRLRGLQTAARIDGRNSDISVALAAAAPVTIYNVGAIMVTAPPGGYVLDAVATDGRITSEDPAIVATPSDGPDARASAKVHGGGPTLTLRSTHGRIEVLKPAGK